MLSNHPSVLGSGGGTAYSLIGGTGLFADGTAAAPSISFAADTDTGIYRVGSGYTGISSNGSAAFSFGFNGADARMNGIAGALIDFKTTGGINIIAGPANNNITLTPSGTGVVSVGAIIAGTAFPNSQLDVNSAGVTLQASSIIDFKTNAGAQAARFQSNTRFCLGTTTDSGALLQIGTNTTNSAGGMVFGTDTYLYRIQAQTLAIQGSGQPGLFFYRASTLSCFIDATATQVRFGSQEAAQSTLIYSGNTTALTLDASQNATFAGSVTAAAAANFTFSGRSYISSPANGIIRLLNNAGTDFSRLQFGGTTASFPALARSGTNLLVVDATGGSYTPILASNFWATGPAVTVSAGNVSYGATTAATVGAAGGASALPATPLGYIIVNVAGTPAKLPYYNS